MKQGNFSSLCLIPIYLQMSDFLWIKIQNLIYSLGKIDQMLFLLALD
jgi:hypothetical protein